MPLMVSGFLNITQYLSILFLDALPPRLSHTFLPQDRMNETSSTSLRDMNHLRAKVKVGHYRRYQVLLKLACVLNKEYESIHREKSSIRVITHMT